MPEVRKQEGYLRARACLRGDIEEELRFKISYRLRRFRHHSFRLRPADLRPAPQLQRVGLKAKTSSCSCSLASSMSAASWACSFFQWFATSLPISGGTSERGRALRKRARAIGSFFRHSSTLRDHVLYRALTLFRDLLVRQSAAICSPCPT
jgi:hypothetical protein